MNHLSTLNRHNLGQLISETFLTQHIDFALTSPYGGGRPGRVKRKRAKAAASGGGEAAAEEEDDD